MDLDRLSYGEKIAGVSAILLFVFMFFDWFGVKGNSGNLLVLFVPFGGGNAWQTLEVIPIFLVFAIVVAVGSALMRLAGSDWKPAVPANAAVTVFGGLASLLILARIVFPPGSSELSNGFSVERRSRSASSSPSPPLSASSSVAAWRCGRRASPSPAYVRVDIEAKGGCTVGLGNALSRKRGRPGGG